MATFEQSGVCKRVEYDRALDQRKFESDIEPGELALMFFAVAGKERIAYKQAVRVANLGSSATMGARNAVDFEFVDEDFQSFDSVPGIMLNGLWNRKDPSDPDDTLIICTKLHELVVVDGCITPYSDETDNELTQMLEKELVCVRSMPLRS